MLSRLIKLLVFTLFCVAIAAPSAKLVAQTMQQPTESIPSSRAPWSGAGPSDIQNVLAQVEAVLAAAELNDPKAEYALGSDYYNGIGVEKDYKEAVDWWRKSADQGIAAAKCSLGRAYHEGKGVEKDDKEAVKWWRQAADQGYIQAQIQLGNAYENGEGVVDDHKEAVNWWRKAAELGDIQMQFQMGRIEPGLEGMKWTEKATRQTNDITNHTANYVRAIWKGRTQMVMMTPEMRTMAEQGDAYAQYRMGMAYYNSSGVDKDDQEAVKWWRKAAEQGNADAQYYLGSAYYAGEGVEKNDAEAVKWLRKSAEQSESTDNRFYLAQLRLGLCYIRGIGVKEDEQEGLRWIDKQLDQTVAFTQATH